MGFAEYIIWLPSRDNVEEVDRTLVTDGYATSVVRGDGEGISWQVHARIEESPDEAVLKP